MSYPMCRYEPRRIGRTVPAHGDSDAQPRSCWHRRRESVGGPPQLQSMVAFMEPLGGPSVLHLNFLCGAEQTLDLSDETIVSVRCYITVHSDSQTRQFIWPVGRRLQCYTASYGAMLLSPSHISQQWADLHNEARPWSEGLT